MGGWKYMMWMRMRYVGCEMEWVVGAWDGAKVFFCLA